MSTFKLKSDKIKYLTKINTLDEIHNNIVSDLDKQNNLLPQKKLRLQKMELQLDKLEKKDPSKYNNMDIKIKSQLKNDIVLIKKEIDDIERSVPETEYYSKIYDILLDYYDVVYQDQEDQKDQDQINHDDVEESDLKDQDNITTETTETKTDHLDLLNIKNRKNKVTKKITKKRKRKDPPPQTTNIMSFLINHDNISTNNNTNSTPVIINNTNNIHDRSKLHKNFSMLVENRHINNNKHISYIKRCNECNQEKVYIQTEGIFVCEKCGEVEMIITEPEKNTTGDIIPDKIGYPYKRINHYSEWLSQFQAKESIEIPQEVYDKIIAELHKNRIYNMKTLTKLKIKEILKKLNLTSYYEHSTHIISKLSGLPPPTISRETEQILREMFKLIQEPFERHCPKDRINFLSYSYVLHKFCELLELDDFIKCFPLLKSREKLRDQDKIWKMICKDLRWQFIPSI